MCNVLNIQRVKYSVEKMSAKQHDTVGWVFSISCTTVTGKKTYTGSTLE